MIKTDRECSALAPPDGKSRVVMTVSSGGNKGLCIEARAGSTTKSWFYRYYIAQKQHKLTLGSYPSVSLAQARVAHAQAVVLVKQGIDPRQVVVEAKKKNEQMLTLDELFEQWLTHKATIKRRDGVRTEISPRTVSDYRRIYNGHLKKALGKRRVCDITMAMLHQHYQTLQRTTLEGLRKSMGIMNQVMAEATRRQLLELSPTLALQPKIYNATPNPPRDRWLPVSELHALWCALDEGVTGGGALAAGGCGRAANTVLSGSVANAIKMVMLTAVRRGEVTSMQWDHLEGDRWTIPDTKSGRPHMVTLSPLALEIIEEQRIISSPENPYVFESSVKPGNAITGNAMMRALERIQKRKMAEFESFSIHDLRRSVANCCGIELGAGPLEVEHMLNHQISDKLLRTYQSGALRSPEKLRALFLRWGEFARVFIAKSERETHTTTVSNVIPGRFGKR